MGSSLIRLQTGWASSSAMTSRKGRGKGDGFRGGSNWAFARRSSAFAFLSIVYSSDRRSHNPLNSGASVMAKFHSIYVAMKSGCRHQQRTGIPSAKSIEPMTWCAATLSFAADPDVVWRWTFSEKGCGTEAGPRAMIRRPVHDCLHNNSFVVSSFCSEWSLFRGQKQCDNQSPQFATSLG